MKRWLSIRLSFLLLGVYIFFLPIAQAVNEDELLDPKDAFAFSATVRADTVIAEWDIADGYYLYRERFQFESNTPGIQLGEPRFPRGKIKEDEFFGQVETYRHKLIVEIPLSRDDSIGSGIGSGIADNAANHTLELKTISQGCADIGVCYPPQTEVVTIALAQENLSSQSLAPTNDVATIAKKNLLAALTGSSSNAPTQAEDELLDPEQAFIPTLSTPNPSTVVAEWTIAEGTYLYRDRFSFESLTPGVRLGEPHFPVGKMKDDEFFGRVEIFRHRLAVEIPLLRESSSSQQLEIKLGFQGCADVGVCYMPQTKLMSVVLGSLAAAIPPLEAATSSGNPAPATDISAAYESNTTVLNESVVSEQDIIAQMLVNKRFLSVPAFFGFGLLLAFTPCVFPMIPILSSIIVGQGTTITQRRAFMLSLVYVLAMAMTYTVAGVLAAMLGQNIQALFQNPWVLAAFSGIFVLLALSMFGFYDLQLPTSWQSKLSKLSNSQSSGNYAGVAIMGLLSALIVGPCVAAPLIGVLTVIATTRDTVLGGTALFVMSLGMGIPLLAIGASAGQLLPRAGRWMNSVKAVFGVLLLGVAIWMLERILPEAITMLLWAILFIISATYMGALQSLGPDVSRWRSLVKGLGVIFLVYGVLLLVGVAAGGKDSLQPLRGVGLLASNIGTSQKHASFQPIKTVADLEKAIDFGISGPPAMQKWL